MSEVENTSKNIGEGNTLEYVLDIIKEGIWDWDANTGHVARSPGWYRMLALDVDVLPNTVFTWENIIHPEDYPRVMQHFDDYINGRVERYEIEYRCRKSDGDYLWIRDQGKVVARNQDGSVARMVGAHLNIHEQKLAQDTLLRQNELLNEDKFTLENLVKQRTAELEAAYRKLEENTKKIEHMSSNDSLTGIFNRRKFEMELNREIARCGRYGNPMSLAIFDVDRFKSINDTLGHHSGDQVLIAISQLVKGHLRDTDILSRWGGDEFAIILPGVGHPQAVQTLEKVRALIEAAGLCNDQAVTCSFGVTQYRDGDSLETIYKRADRALYQAKDAGRNSIRHA